MKWDEVAAAVRKALMDDTELRAALGTGGVEPMESNIERKIPSIRYQVIADTIDETMNHVLLQVDHWALSRAKAIAMERRIRIALHLGRRAVFDLPEPGGTIAMWVIHLDGRDMDDPQAGVVHRSNDFRCVPLRGE